MLGLPAEGLRRERLELGEDGSLGSLGQALTPQGPLPSLDPCNLALLRAGERSHPNHAEVGLISVSLRQASCPDPREQEDRNGKRILTNTDHNPGREEKQDYRAENNAAPGRRRPCAAGSPPHLGSQLSATLSGVPHSQGHISLKEVAGLRVFIYIPSQNRYLIGWSLTFLSF